MQLLQTHTHTHTHTPNDVTERLYYEKEGPDYQKYINHHHFKIKVSTFAPRR